MAPKTGATQLFCQNAAVDKTMLLIVHGADPKGVSKKGLTAEQTARTRGLMDADDRMSRAM